MKTTNQISVFLENHPGYLNEIVSVLAKENIDLRALNIAETSDYGLLRLIADDPDKAAEVLSSHGFLYTLSPVGVVWVPDKPGGLSAVLSAIAGANIDIEYMYSCFSKESGKADMIFRVNNLDELDNALQNFQQEDEVK